MWREKIWPGYDPLIGTKGWSMNLNADRTGVGNLGLTSGNYRRWLMEKIEERKLRVPSYSLRSFAAKLGVSAASLSQVISGKRPLTRKMAVRIAERLSLDPDETQALIVAALKARYDSAVQPGVAAPQPSGEDELRIDSFRLISDWYHYAILNLLDVRGAKNYPEWFARRLGISVLEAHQALLRLKRMGLVEAQGLTLRRTRKNLKTQTDIEEAAIRRYHHQNLRKAEESLDRDGIDTRDFGAITVAIDPENLPKAKLAVKKFRRQLGTLLSGGKRERVYTFVTQLFPVDRANGNRSGH